MQDTARADKATSVQALLTEWQAREAAAQGPVNAYTVPTISWSVPDDAALAALLDRFWHEVDEAIGNANARVAQENHRAPPFPAPTRQQLREYLAADQPSPTTTFKLHHLAEKAVHTALERLPEQEGASLVLLLNDAVPGPVDIYCL